MFQQTLVCLVVALLALHVQLYRLEIRPPIVLLPINLPIHLDLEPHQLRDLLNLVVQPVILRVRNVAVEHLDEG